MLCMYEVHSLSTGDTNSIPEDLDLVLDQLIDRKSIVYLIAMFQLKHTQGVLVIGSQRSDDQWGQTHDRG